MARIVIIICELDEEMIWIDNPGGPFTDGSIPTNCGNTPAIREWLAGVVDPICFDRISLPMVGYDFAPKYQGGKVDQ